MSRTTPKTRLEALREVVTQGSGPILIALHDFPDPDCLASALGLQRLFAAWGIRADIADGRGMGRAENKAMAGLLQIATQLYDAIDRDSYRGAVLADTQPGQGNNSLPGDVPILAVVDHHPLHAEGYPAIPFVDIRTEIGATSTMILQYLIAEHLPIEKHLATALYLGIKTDTEELERSGNKADIRAYAKLLPLVDMSLVRKITRPPLSDEVFALLHAALESAMRYDEAVVANVGPIPEPDYLSTVSELLLRAKGASYALTLGVHQGRIHLSLRVRPPRKNAGELLKKTVFNQGTGGGHALAAGGVIDPGSVFTPNAAGEAIERFLQAINHQEAPGRHLVPDPEAGVESGNVRRAGPDDAASPGKETGPAAATIGDGARDAKDKA